MNGNSKLSEAIKHNPDVIEYLISLNPHDFQRLRNPLMRKVMPVRISLRRLATMVNIPEQDFVDKINEICGLPSEPVGEDTDSSPKSPVELPAWMMNVDERVIQWVDVLPGDEKLDDPMPPINIGVNGLQPGETLGIKHKWEPQPLFDIWSKRGLEFYTHQVGPDEWHIFVHKPVS